MHHPTRRTRPLALLLLATVASGCGSLNRGIGPGDPVALPALAGPSPSLIAGRGEAEPSLAGIDRQQWARQTVRVPLREVESYPTYVFTVEGPQDTPRRRGAYPTALSALDAERGSLRDAGLASLAVVVAPLAIVWAPVQMIGGTGPFSTERNPTGTFPLEPETLRETSFAPRWIGTDGAAPAETPEDAP